AMALGSLVILAGGWAWLALMFRTAGEAFRLGVAPFLPGDLVKIALAAAALPGGWALLRRQNKGGE
ncbi:MAG TPA: biotin transporter BioY, partial [Pyrinomonadaceae bacterium]